MINSVEIDIKKSLSSLPLLYQTCHQLSKVCHCNTHPVPTTTKTKRTTLNTQKFK